MFECFRRLHNHLDQRFHNADEESAYVQNGERSRLMFVTWGAITVAVSFVAYDAFFVFQELRQDVDPLVPWTFDWRWFTPGLSVVSSAIFLLAASIAQLKLRRNYFGRFDSELLTVFVAIVFFARLTLGRRYNLVFFDRALDAAWVQRVDVQDTSPLLAFDGCVTALALSACLRVHLLVLVVSPAFLMWVLVTAICGSPEGHGLSHMFALFCLIAFACSGSARAETFFRREWRQQARLEEQEEQMCLQAALAKSLQQVAEQLCDLVVHLDPELCVHTNSVPANSFFGRGMFGQSLLDVVEPTDRVTLLDAFSRASEAHVPQCVPATLAEGAYRGRVAQLLIASTGTRLPKFLVGVSAEAEPHYEAGPSLRCDVSEALAEARVAGEASECQTTASGRAFLSADFAGILALGHAERWCIEAEDLRVPVPHSILGEGGFGVVATACYLGQTVAVKVARGGAGSLRAALMELRVLRRFRHPNVVLLHGAVVDPARADIALVYELLGGVMLHELLETRRGLSDFDRFQILYATSSALSCLHMHSPSIVHGDLKPQNIMVEETCSGFRPKLLDFGLSKFQGRSVGISGGTLAWQAPETLLPHSSAGTASDVFSFGWLALLIISGAYPYGGVDLKTLRRILQDMVEQQQSPCFVVPEVAPFRAECQALCAACLQFDPAQRPSMSQVQVALAGWVVEDAFCQLGVAAATRALRQLPWRLAAGALMEAEAAASPEAKVNIDANSGFRVTRAEGVGALPLPALGDCFCDWLEDPVGFRIFVLASLADLRSGARAAPLQQRLGLVLWRGEEPRRLAIRILFPSTSGLVKLRLRFASNAAEPRTLQL